MYGWLRGSFRASASDLPKAFGGQGGVGVEFERALEVRPGTFGMAGSQLDFSGQAENVGSIGREFGGSIDAHDRGVAEAELELKAGDFRKGFGGGSEFVAPSECLKGLLVR